MVDAVEERNHERVAERRGGTRSSAASKAVALTATMHRSTGARSSVSPATWVAKSPNCLLLTVIPSAWSAPAVAAPAYTGHPVSGPGQQPGEQPADPAGAENGSVHRVHAEQ